MEFKKKEIDRSAGGAIAFSTSSHALCISCSFLGVLVIALLGCATNSVAAASEPTGDEPGISHVVWTKVETVDEIKAVRDSLDVRKGIVMEDPVPDVLESLALVEDLEALDLRISDDKYLGGVDQVANLKSLRILFFAVAKEVTKDDRLAGLLQQLPELRQLKILNPQVNGDLTVALKDSVKLRDVTLAITTALDAKIVQALQESDVRNLSLHMYGYEGDGRDLFRSITTLPDIEKVYLKGIPESVAPSSFDEFAMSTTVTELTVVGYSRLDKEVVDSIAAMTGLRVLTLRGFECDDEVVGSIGGASDLRKLVIGEASGSVSSEVLRQLLGSLKSLENLVLLGAARLCPLEKWIGGGTTILRLEVDAERSLSTAAFQEIAKMPALKWLSLGVSDITIKDLKVVLANTNDSLKEIDVSSVPVEFDDDELAALRKQYPDIEVKTAFN